jgi:hypothetical protein
MKTRDARLWAVAMKHARVRWRMLKKKRFKKNNGRHFQRGWPKGFVPRKPWNQRMSKHVRGYHKEVKRLAQEFYNAAKAAQGL